MRWRRVVRASVLSLTIWFLPCPLGPLCGLLPTLIKKTAEGAEDGEDCFAGSS